MSIQTAVLQGTYYQPDDVTPSSGSYVVIPNSKVIVDPAGNRIIAGRLSGRLDDNGHFSVTLPATDDATLQPAVGRQYTLLIKLDQSRTDVPKLTGLELLHGQTYDTADLTSGVEASAVYSAFLTEEQWVALSDTVAANTTALGTKVNSSTYTNGLAGKADTTALTTEAARATAAEVALQNGTNATFEARQAAAFAALGDVASTRTTDGALTAGKHNPVDSSSGNRTVTLAAAAAKGVVTSVEKTDSSVNTVTITAKFRGSGTTSTLTLLWQNEALELVSDAAGTWWPKAGHKTKASLDAVYAQIAKSFVVVVHNADPNVARPAAPAVYWVGTVQPNNEQDPDFWYNPTGTADGPFEPFNGDSAHLLTSGESTFSRRLPLSGNSSVSQGLRLTYLTAIKTETITSLRIVTGGTGAGATPTLCRLGVYLENSDGSLTLVASTANDTSLFAAANTIYTKALTASWNKVRGQRYAIGRLVVTAAATPTFRGIADAGGMVNEWNTAPKLSAQWTGQSDLPAAIPVANQSASAQMDYIAAVP